jgi:Flp pilus assembly protein TadD
LEFSFGRTDRALAALNKSLALAPRNAQALALQAFLLAAQNNIREAIESFNQAIAVDSALGNAWLGRGLCHICQGDANRGREDLLIAAALEPQRSLLRSYLGKAYGNVGDAQRARHELELAKGLDRGDPTSWLYSALLDQQNNRFNEGIRDLEESIALNKNRRLYRSRLLLDQDQAVRSSSLASLYREAGMPDVSVREAARAVSYDYANYSAHLFLAESYDALRDPTRFNLRYETTWFNELLLANLLSPVSGTSLSQNISQHEYSRLFEQDRVGLSSWTEYRSDDQIRELASQYGNIRNTAWALDLDYQHNDGVRPNNELDRIEWYTTIKQQLTPQDSIMLLAKDQDYHSGDNFQYFNPDAEADSDFRFDEYQRPIALAGYHHEWAPGLHTLALAGFLQNEQQVSDGEVQRLLLASDGTSIFVPGAPLFDITYQSKFEAGTGELNQIFQNNRHTLVFGGRYQRGSIRTSNQITKSGAPDPLLPPVDDETDENFERGTAYAYYSIKVVDPLVLLGGVAYDRVRYPENFRNPPVTPGEAEREQIGPKAALTWTPAAPVTVRGAYSRSLGGVTLDQSTRLEPTQLAGFAQTFRTVIPESLAGSVSAPRFETVGFALDLKLGGGAYLGLSGERVASEVNRPIGVFLTDSSSFPPTPAVVASTPEKLDFLERSAGLTLNRIVADEWAFGLSYRFTRSELRTTLSEVPVTVLASADHTEESDLHQFRLFTLFNHPSGFFTRAELDWYLQQNRETRFNGSAFLNEGLPGDEFPQLNLFAGYRFSRQHGDITLGVLNLTGEDYHLKPLNFYSELPRKRVFYARLRFRF